MKYKVKKDCQLFTGTPPRLKSYKKDGDIKLTEYDSIDSLIKQDLVYKVKEEKEVKTPPQADLSAKNEPNDLDDKDTQLSELDGFKAIFDVTPEKLTIPELKIMCDDLKVKYNHNTKEATLIKRINSAQGK
jgi:hypothetical protein